MCPHIVSLRLVVEGETQRWREGGILPAHRRHRGLSNFKQCIMA